MKTDLWFRSGSFLLLSLCLCAQQTPPPASPVSPAAPAAPAATAKGDELRKAFVDADGARRATIGAAAEAVMATDQTGRARFLATLRAIAAVAPAAAAPAPAAPGTLAGAPAVAPAKPPEFDAEMKKLMAEAIGSDAEAQKASLGKLAADQTTGAAALTQLDERGKLILGRCVSTFLGRRLATNAIFAGQFTELRDLDPEASNLLLRWAKEAPKDVANPEQFRTACLRALRDTLTAEQATDQIRTELKGLAEKAQGGRNQDQFITAVCALHQFGDASLFDKIKGGVLKRAESGSDEAKSQATNMLAELHYQARMYEDAATYYKSFLAMVEKAPEPPQGMPTYVYNTACSLALAGKTDEALQYLEKAVEVGTKAGQPLTKTLFDTDHDIDSLRADPRFQAIYEKNFGKVTKPAK